MASNVPTIRQLNWLALIPQIAVIGLFIYGYSLVDVGDPFIFGALTYSVLAFVLRGCLNFRDREQVRESGLQEKG